jgi:glutathione S-transferase
MKIYEMRIAPNPRRVRIFLAEKGVTVPFEQVDLFRGESKTAQFLGKNPLGAVPVLELDDGTCIAESVAICRYFEGLHPNPPLMGTGTLGQASVEMWQRRMELYVFFPIELTFLHSSELFKARPQVAEFAEVSRQRAYQGLEWLDAVLATRRYVAGDDYTIADITALVAVDFTSFPGIEVKPDLRHLKRWHAEVSGRPSAQA